MLVQDNAADPRWLRLPWEVDEDSTGAECWHVLHTKSRQEKILSNELNAMRIKHFLPLVRQIRYYAGRKASVEIPLFPGYVFLHSTLDEAYLADRTKRVVQIIRVHDQQHIGWELKNIYQALSTGAPLEMYPGLQKGVRVEVRSGPFAGLQGIVQERNSNRLILQVEMLGQAVSLEVDGSLLDVIE